MRIAPPPATMSPLVLSPVTGRPGRFGTSGTTVPGVVSDGEVGVSVVGVVAVGVGDSDGDGLGESDGDGDGDGDGEGDGEGDGDSDGGGGDGDPEGGGGHSMWVGSGVQGSGELP